MGELSDGFMAIHGCVAPLIMRQHGELCTAGLPLAGEECYHRKTLKNQFIVAIWKRCKADAWRVD